MTERNTNYSPRTIIEMLSKRLEKAGLDAGNPNTVYVLKNGEEYAFSMDEVKGGLKLPAKVESIEIGFGNEDLYLSLNPKTGKLDTNNFIPKDESKINEIIKGIFKTSAPKPKPAPESVVIEDRLESIEQVMARFESGQYDILEPSKERERKETPANAAKYEKVVEEPKKRPKNRHGLNLKPKKTKKEERRTWGKGGPSGANLDQYIIEMLQIGGLTYTGIVDDYDKTIGLPKVGKRRRNKKREIADRLEYLKKSRILTLNGNVYEIRK